MIGSFVAPRFVLAVAAALLGVVASLPASAADLTAPKPTERRLLGQSIDRPLTADTDPEVTKTLAELRGKAQTQGKVRVIVGVRAAFAPEGNLSDMEVQTQRADIASVQRRVHARLPKLAANKVTHFEFIPFTALEVDGDELDTLAEMSEVTDIQEDRLSAPTLAESLPLIRGNEAWAAGYTGSNWTVAVLDTGVDKTHPFLSGKVVSESCYSTTNSLDGATSVCPGGVSASTATDSGVNCALSIEGCKHGTHVAGIAAGLGNFSGVARGANVIAIQVFSRVNNLSLCGSGSPCALSYGSDRIKALERIYALRTNYNIAAVNISIGGGRYYTQSACDSASGSEKATIDLLRSVNIATVIASGNDGYTDSASAPGCISSAVIVGATFDAPGYGNSCDGWNGGLSSVDEVACFSNSASFLDLLAPGADINSSVPGGSFENLQGTSMAAPHVAGCWAILKQARPTATVDQIELALKNTGVPVTDWRTGLIKPRIDCKAALDSLLGTGGIAPNLTVSTFAVSPTIVSAGGAVSFAAAVRNAGAATSSATTLRYFESSGSTWSEMTFCRTSISSLAPGATSNQSCGATAPSIAITKSFYVAVDPVFGETVTADNLSNIIGLTVTSAAIPTYLLTLTKAGTGSGTVTGPGINCGSDCAESYASGTVVSLTATPSAGTTFTGWSGACTGGSCQIFMNGAKGVTANFVLTPPNLTISTFTASPTTVSVGGTVNLAAIVRNAGAGSSSATTLRYYYWTGSVWSEMTSCLDSIGVLAPGATSSQSCAIIPPPTPGTYYYSVTVDAVSGESITTDNFADYVTVTVTPAIPAMPGTATVATNPYGALSVQGGTLTGSTISNLQQNAVIQLGSAAGIAGSFVEIDFQGFNIAPGNTFTVRSGAPGQSVFLYNADATASSIAGTLQTQGGNGAPTPVLYFQNPNGIVVDASGNISALSGLVVDALSDNWTVGQNLINTGVLDGGSSLDLYGSKVTGGGVFKGNTVHLRTYGNANNPVNGAHFLANGLQLYPSIGSAVALTLNAYGSAPQALNVMVHGNAAVWMPSAWPAGSGLPPNNLPVPPGGGRPAGAPAPGFGGGSMIVQATGTLSLVNGGTNDFVFPGAIVLKSTGDLNVNGVVVNNSWTAAGQSFQGVFFESPNIGSSTGNIQVLTNNLNWVNFSTLPHAPVRTWQLVPAANGSLSHLAADSIAPHRNTYSILIEAAAAGQCWVCLVNTAPVNMH